MPAYHKLRKQQLLYAFNDALPCFTFLTVDIDVSMRRI